MIVSASAPTKTVVRHPDLYEAKGLPTEFTVPQPFELFDLNEEALAAKGLVPSGVVRQLNQVFGENVLNIFGAQVRAAVKAETDLPNQASLDTIVANYDFSGVRTRTDEASLPTADRYFATKLRESMRALLKEGFLSADGSSQLVQSKKDAEEGNVPKPGKMAYEDFEDLVEVARQGDIWVGPVVTKEHHKIPVGEQITADFSAEPIFTESGLARNLAAVRTQAWEAAQAELSKRQTPIMAD